MFFKEISTTTLYNFFQDQYEGADPEMQESVFRSNIRVQIDQSFSLLCQDSRIKSLTQVHLLIR